MSPADGDAPRRGGRGVPRALWLALLTAPLAWGLFTTFAWTSAEPACRSGGSALPAAAVATALAAGLLGLVAAARAMGRSRLSGEADPGAFIVSVGLLVGALLMLGLAIAGAYVVAIDPCW